MALSAALAELTAHPDGRVAVQTLYGIAEKIVHARPSDGDKSAIKRGKGPTWRWHAGRSTEAVSGRPAVACLPLCRELGAHLSKREPQSSVEQASPGPIPRGFTAGSSVHQGFSRGAPPAF